MAKSKKKMKKPKPGVQLPPALQLSEHEKANLYSAALRCEGVLDNMLARLTASELEAEEEKFRLLFAASRSLWKSDSITPFDKGYQKRLRSQVRSMAKSEGLDGPLADAAEELAGPDGCIAQAFETDPEEFDKSYINGLMKRYVEYYHAVLPLHDYLTRVLSEGCMPESAHALLEELGKRVRQTEGLGDQTVRAIGERWKEHNARLKTYRGKQMIGLKTGLPVFDRNTLGVRGLFFIAARPGAGKTTFTLQVCIGVCRHHAENDAVVIVVSLDMDAHDLMDRIHCNLGGVDWQVLKFGSKEEDREPGKMFSKAAAEQLAEAEQRLKDEQVGARLMILDRTDLGDNITAARLAAVVKEAKKKTGAKRAVLVVDYLQLVPVPEEEAGSDLAADKARVRLVQQVIEGSRTADNPAGDAALVISEARKPPNAKEKWGSSRSELMGSARLAYAADAVLLYHEMSDKQVMEHYGLGKDDVAAKRKALADKGVVPLVLNLEKGRDGMRRGYWTAEFDYRRSVFVEKEPGAKAVKSLPAGSGDPAPGKGPAGTDTKLPPAENAAPFATLKKGGNGKKKSASGNGKQQGKSTAKAGLPGKGGKAGAA